jgi:hypothetical protein
MLSSIRPSSSSEPGSRSKPLQPFAGIERTTGPVPLPQQAALAIVLERSGFANWKMTEVRLPVNK